MKKIFIATKQTKQGLHQIVSTIDTNECTVQTKTYYDGKIYKKETYYNDVQSINDMTWDSDKEYYTRKQYTIIVL